MYFEQKQITPAEVSNAGKEKIDRRKAWEIIRSRNMVYIGKGKKVLALPPEPERKEEILKSAMGRSGNLRAPAVKTDKAVFIGYNDEIYNAL